MGAALSQADPNLKAAKEAEQKEIAGGQRAFGKTLKDKDLLEAMQHDIPMVCQGRTTLQFVFR